MEHLQILNVLVAKAKEVRQAQINYFTRGRMGYDLAKSKKLEREFDEYLDHLVKRGFGKVDPTPTQQTLL
jgi:hypothetical protein